MVNGNHFQSLSCASVFEEDIQGQTSLLVAHDNSVSSAVTEVEFCRGNRVAITSKQCFVHLGHHFEVMWQLFLCVSPFVKAKQR